VSKSVVTIGREMAEKVFAGRDGAAAITITESGLAHLLSAAALAGYESCSTDVHEMLSRTGSGTAKPGSTPGSS
jgi:hypothetical protein